MPLFLQVGWEAMIDALVLLPLQASEGDAIPMIGKQHMAVPSAF